MLILKKLGGEDEWSEDEAEIPAGVTDIILTSTDFLEDNECQYILNIASAEGNRPFNIFKDNYSEEQFFISISWNIPWSTMT